MTFSMFLYGVPQNIKFSSSEEFWKYVEEDSNNYRNDVYAERYGGWTGHRPIHYWFQSHGKVIEPGICYKISKKDLVELMRDCALAYLDPKGPDNAIFPYPTVSREGWKDIQDNFLYIIEDVACALNDYDHPKNQFIYIAE